jgi:hypothetical protein
LIVVLCASGAAAQNAPPERRTGVSVHVGVDPVVAGQLVREAETSGNFGTARVHRRSYPDIYGLARMLGGELSYGFADGREALARVTVTRSASRGAVELRENIARFPASRTTSTAEFSDYNTLTIEGGVRWHLKSEGVARPYVGGSGGVAIVGDITIDPPLRTPPPFGPAMVSNVFFTRSTVPTLAGIAGIAFAVRPELQLRLESGLRFQGRPDAEPSDEWTGPWLNDVYDGLRWSIPITAALHLRF